MATSAAAPTEAAASGESDHPPPTHPSARMSGRSSTISASTSSESVARATREDFHVEREHADGIGDKHGGPDQVGTPLPERCQLPSSRLWGSPAQQGIDLF